jgi:peptidoglycan/LPS O-acetylase OafA/YrhL
MLDSSFGEVGNMLEAILSLLVIAIVGALTVPVMMLTLARFGYFEPIRFTLFGRYWRFAPRPTMVVQVGSANRGFAPRRLAFASAVTTTVFAALPSHSPNPTENIYTTTNAVLAIRNIQ